MDRAHRTGGAAGLLIALVLSGCSGAQPHQNSPSTPSAMPSTHAGTTSACGAIALPERPVTVAELVGRRFVATSYDDCGVTRHLARGTRFTLTFTAKVPGMRGPQLTFSTGCNGGGGGVAISGGRLHVTRMVTTAMACLSSAPHHPKRMRRARQGLEERVLTTLLQQKPRISTRGNGTLLLTGERTTIQFHETGRATVPKGFETPK